MQEEGVIKFDLRFSEHAPVALEYFTELNRWRSLLWEQALIGQDPIRYGGYGYGNVSQRLPHSPERDGQRAFLISGSQTGHLPELLAKHYAVVTAYDPVLNYIKARGPIRPSSESLTHAMVYDQSDDIRVVLHVHSPDIWLAADRLQLPVTDASVAYGTPAMADEVRRLFRETGVAGQRIFSMGGHADGIVAFGKTADEAGSILIRTLSDCRDNC
ncbi:MAG: class II aldolase/adducin family protein [Gammaproteobacteria bacterium]